jgi:hypothetical protein
VGEVKRSATNGSLADARLQLAQRLAAYELLVKLMFPTLHNIVKAGYVFLPHGQRVGRDWELQAANVKAEAEGFNLEIVYL